jgi:hypothetical protein
MHAVEEGLIPKFADAILAPSRLCKEELDCVVESLFSKSSN